MAGETIEVTELRKDADTTTTSDAADAALAAAGDASAFERLYRNHVDRIHSLARRMLGPDDADEATQDAFVRAWEKLHTFRGDSAFGTWMHRLAINVILGRRKKAGLLRSRTVDSEDAIESVAGKAAQTDLSMDFQVAIEQLPDGARKVFVLHDVEGFKHREISEMMGITSGTSKAQLHRARMALRNSLDR